MKPLLSTIALTMLAGTSFADSHAPDPLAASGDVGAGQSAFKRQCASCHVVKDDEGNTLAGKRARSGPNLYDMVGNPAGVVEEFRYGKSLVKAGAEAGLIWDEASFVSYVQDPSGYLKTVLDDPRARAKMSFKVRKEQDAIDMYAFLASLEPAAPEEDAAAQ